MTPDRAKPVSSSSVSSDLLELGLSHLSSIEQEIDLRPTANIAGSLIIAGESVSARFVYPDGRFDQGELPENVQRRALTLTKTSTLIGLVSQHGAQEDFPITNLHTKTLQKISKYPERVSLDKIVVAAEELTFRTIDQRLTANKLIIIIGFDPVKNPHGTPSVLSEVYLEFAPTATKSVERALKKFVSNLKLALIATQQEGQTESLMIFNKTLNVPITAFPAEQQKSLNKLPRTHPSNIWIHGIGRTISDESGILPKPYVLETPDFISGVPEIKVDFDKVIDTAVGEKVRSWVPLTWASDKMIEELGYPEDQYGCNCLSNGEISIPLVKPDPLDVQLNVFGNIAGLMTIGANSWSALLSGLDGRTIDQITLPAVKESKSEVTTSAHHGRTITRPIKGKCYDGKNILQVSGDRFVFIDTNVDGKKLYIVDSPLYSRALYIFDHANPAQEFAEHKLSASEARQLVVSGGWLAHDPLDKWKEKAKQIIDGTSKK